MCLKPSDICECFSIIIGFKPIYQQYKNSGHFHRHLEFLHWLVLESLTNHFERFPVPWSICLDTLFMFLACLYQTESTFWKFQCRHERDQVVPLPVGWFSRLQTGCGKKTRDQVRPRGRASTKNSTRLNFAGKGSRICSLTTKIFYVIPSEKWH